jgi:hypothetical protein
LCVYWNRKPTRNTHSIATRVFAMLFRICSEIRQVAPFRNYLCTHVPNQRTQELTDGVICSRNNTFFFLGAKYGFLWALCILSHPSCCLLHLFSSNKHVQIHPFREWAARRSGWRLAFRKQISGCLVNSRKYNQGYNSGIIVDHGLMSKRLSFPLIANWSDHEIELRVR